MNWTAAQQVAECVLKTTALADQGAGAGACELRERHQREVGERVDLGGGRRVGRLTLARDRDDRHGGAAVARAAHRDLCAPLGGGRFRHVAQRAQRERHGDPAVGGEGARGLPDRLKLRRLEAPRAACAFVRRARPSGSSGHAPTGRSRPRAPPPPRAATSTVRRSSWASRAAVAASREGSARASLPARRQRKLVEPLPQRLRRSGRQQGVRHRIGDHDLGQAAGSEALGLTGELDRRALPSLRAGEDRIEIEHEDPLRGRRLRRDR